MHSDQATDYVDTMDGTSMATPLSASVAALIWSRNPELTAAQVREILLANADPIDNLSCNGPYQGKLGAGRINAYKAVTAVMIHHIPGDIDSDGDVDGKDLSSFINLIGLSSEDPGYVTSADTNSDGFIDINDLPIFAEKFGEMN